MTLTEPKTVKDFDSEASVGEAQAFEFEAGETSGEDVIELEAEDSGDEREAK